VTAIAAGRHNLALRDDGTAKLRRTPVSVAGLADVTAVAAGGSHGLALSSSGGV